MKKAVFSKYSLIVVLILCLSLILGMTGCKRDTPDLSADPGDKTPTQTQTDTGAKTDINDNPKTDTGKSVADFDEFVNGEWKREQETLDKGDIFARNESVALVKERIRDILENTDPAGLSEDDGLYKAIMIYRGLKDTEDMQARLTAASEYLAPIEKAASLEDLYKLYVNDRYSIVNLILRFEVKGDEYGNNILNFSPMSLTENILKLMPSEGSDEDRDSRERLMKFMSELGYSEERVDEILENAMKAAAILDKYPQKNADGTYSFYYFTEDQFAEVPVPLFDILREQDALGATEGIMASATCFDLLKELYVADNFEALRDYMLLSAETALYSASGYKTLFDIPDFDYDDQVVTTMMAFAGDVLAKAYMERYYSEENAESLRVLTADIKEAAKQVIYDAECFTAFGKEEARAKLMKMRAFAGKNGYANELTDVVLSDNAIENYIRLYTSHDNFVRNQTTIQGDYRRPFDCYLFDVNGYYVRGYNAYTLTAGLLCDPKCSEEVPYEERLASLGFVIAHEIGHAFDPNNISCDEYGFYNPWMKEEEIEKYVQNIQRITEKYDGLEFTDGQKISGQRVTAETFADLMAMQICLKMLEDRENADYDLFFRTYAKFNAAYYSKEGIDLALLDPHLPGNLRINCILGQFDKFYEIYNIDENSPYFVPEEERLKVL